MNTLVVIGSAPNALDDLIRFSEINQTDVDYMAVGKNACVYPIDWKFIATGHIEDIPEIRSKCDAANYQIISHNKSPYVSIIEPIDTWRNGSSALLGVMAALRMGYKKVVLCGCPMKGPNPGHKGANYSMFQSKWGEVAKQIRHKVKSMSGRTAELLGEPTKEWLNEPGKPQ